MLAGAVIVGGIVYGWIHAPLFVQREILTVGWAGLAIITALQTLFMVGRILRPTRGLRPDASAPEKAPRLRPRGLCLDHGEARRGHRDLVLLDRNLGAR